MELVEEVVNTIVSPYLAVFRWVSVTEGAGHKQDQGLVLQGGHVILVQTHHLVQDTGTVQGGEAFF